MSGIQTSTITTATDANLALDPAGTGKIVITDEVGGGETPLSTDNEGKVGELNTDALTLLPDEPIESDLVMIQSGGVQYKVAATAIGGSSNADPSPSDVTANPPFEGGNGTQGDPYILTPAVVPIPGGSTTSAQYITVANQSPGTIASFLPSPGGARFAQPPLIFGATGSEGFYMQYVDSPVSSTGTVYNAAISLGRTTVYFSWQVTQVNNATQLSPAGLPNATPSTVNYVSDSKYGEVSGVWADGAQTVSATGIARFSINGAAATTAGTGVVNANNFAVTLDATTVDAAAQDAVLTGVINGTNGYYLPVSLTVNRNADAFASSTIQNVPVSSVVVGNILSLRGINCRSTILYVAAGTTMTSPEVSVNGAAYTALSTSAGVNFNPGDTLQLRATTGATDGTNYTLEVQVGTTTQTFGFTTATAAAAIQTPQVITPINGAVDVGNSDGTVSLVGNAYSGNSAAGAHTKSSWQTYSGNPPLTSTNVITNVAAPTSPTFSTITRQGSYHYAAVWGGCWPPKYRKGTTDLYGQFTNLGIIPGSYYNFVTSTDGVSWSAPYNFTPNSTNNITSETFSVSQGSFFAVRTSHPADSTNDGLYRNYGNSASSWTKITTPYFGLPGHLWGCPTILFAPSGNGWYASFDAGQTWSAKITRPDGASGGVSPRGFYWLNTGGLHGTIVISAGGSANKVFTSTDGLTWTTVNLPFGINSDDGNCSAGNFMILFESGYSPINQYLLTTDGYTFTTHSTPVTNTWSGQSYTPSAFGYADAATGHEGVIGVPYITPGNPTYSNDGDYWSTTNGIDWNHEILPNGTGALSQGGWGAEGFYANFIQDQGPNTTNECVGLPYGYSDIAIAGAQTDGFGAGDTIDDCGTGTGAAIISLNNTTVTILGNGVTKGFGTGDNICRSASGFALVDSSIDDTTNLTSYSIPSTAVAINTTYNSRVSYGSATTQSAWSDYSTYTTGDFIPTPGSAFAGGYFAGQVNISSTIYNLIVAPVGPVGLLYGQYGGAGSNTQTGLDAAATYAYGWSQDLSFGGQNTWYQAAGGCPFAMWSTATATGPNAGTYDTTNAAGTGIGGFNDWYIPAAYEMQVCFYYLKPGPATTTVPASYPVPIAVAPMPTANSSVSQTSSTIFQSGGAQQFTTANNTTTGHYWCSTPVNSQTYQLLWDDGTLGLTSSTNSSNQTRAIRRQLA